MEHDAKVVKVMEHDEKVQNSTKRLLKSVTLDYCLQYFRHSPKFSIQNTAEFFSMFIKDLTSTEIKQIMEVRKKLDIKEIELYRYIRYWIFLNNDEEERKKNIEEILLKYIDFLKIPSKIFKEEIENDTELKRNKSFLKKILSIKNEKEGSESAFLRKIINENYSRIGEESLYYVTFDNITIHKINFELKCSELVYEHNLNRFGYSICNFKYDNRDYFLFSGGRDKDLKNNKTKIFDTNLIWSPGNYNSEGSLKGFPTLLQPRSDHDTIFFDDKIFACGGYISTENYDKGLLTKSSEIFDFGYEKWITGPEFVNSKQKFALAATDRSLYVFDVERDVTTVESYDSRENKWKVIPSQYRGSCYNVFPCSESSILCATRNGPSFIFDTRKNQFVPGIYNSKDGYLLWTAVKSPNGFYGAYVSRTTSGEINFCKLDNLNTWKDWKLNLTNAGFCLLLHSD